MGQGASAADMLAFVANTLLKGENISPNNAKAWQTAFSVPLTSVDMLHCITSASLRTLRKSNPATLAALLYNCIRVIDRTTALQLGLEKFLVQKRAVEGTSVEIEDEEDTQTCLLFFDEKELANERVQNAQRRMRNVETATKIREAAMAKMAKRNGAKTSDSVAAPAEGASKPAVPASIAGGPSVIDPLAEEIANPLKLAKGAVEVPRPFHEMHNNERRAFQNALALIFRLMPIVLEEDPSAPTSNAYTATANPPTLNDPSASPASSSGPSPFASTFMRSFFIENSTCGSDHAPFYTATGTRKNTNDDDGSETLKPLAEVLVNVLVRAAFVPGFTVEASQTVSDRRPINMPFVDSALLWAPGVGMADANAGGGSSSSPAFRWSNAEWAITNRRLVLDALLNTLSAQLYVPDPLRVDVFVETITCPDRCPLAATLVASMINIVCSYSTFGSLPFSSHFVGQLEQFVFTSSELVCIMLNTQRLYPAVDAGGNASPAITPNVPSNFDDYFSAASPRDDAIAAFPATSNNAPPPSTSDEGVTAAAKAKKEKKPPLAKLTAPSVAAFAHLVMHHYHTAWSVLISASTTEVSFVLKGLLHLVNNRTYSKSTRLPGTQRRMTHHDAFFLLMWKLVDRCPNFFEPLTTEADVALPFVIPLLDYGLAAKDNGSLFANAQIVAFTLMRLSSARDFALLLNAPLTQHIPFKCPALPKGTYNDLMIVSMLQLLYARQQPKKAALKLAASSTVGSGGSFPTSSAAAGSFPAMPKIPADSSLTPEDVLFAQQCLAAQQQSSSSSAATPNNANATQKPVYRLPPTPIMSIHETCAIVICNISPYITRMLTNTAMGLISFLELAIKPSWLGLHPSYPNILCLLIESFANMIQYQYGACPALLYSLCRERPLIHKVHREITEPLRVARAERLKAQQQQQQQNQNQIAGFVEVSTANISPNQNTSSPTSNGEGVAASDNVSAAASPSSLFGLNGNTTANSSQVERDAEAAAAAAAASLSPATASSAAATAPSIPTLASEDVLPMAIREKIKIGTLLCAVDAAEPILVRAIAKSLSQPDPVAILANTTLVGLLPAPHPIIVRKFAPHPTTDAWTTAVLWGFIFMNESSVGDAQRIRLFSLDRM